MVEEREDEIKDLVDKMEELDAIHQEDLDRLDEAIKQLEDAKKQLEDKERELGELDNEAQALTNDLKTVCFSSRSCSKSRLTDRILSARRTSKAIRRRAER